MFLRAGAVSLLLLLASRVLGLVRESAQAAAFGASAAADIAVVMLTLPDWIAGLVASGALGYVLLPAWSRAPAEVESLQWRVTQRLLAVGAAMSVLLLAGSGLVAGWLLPGVPAEARPDAGIGLGWSALAMPLALLASLWATRLQYERDFVGVYGANLAANVFLIGTLLALALGSHRGLPAEVMLLGAGLLAAMLGRLAWLGWRQRRFARPASPGAATVPALPLWLWAAAAAGLPLALPFAARSLASHEGAGALATFSYAWKLIELPLLLAIQLVATIALGPIAHALVAADAASASSIIRRGFALAWALACASAAALFIAAPALAQLLFGWGRMDAGALVQVAAWARVGAWGLLPQAITAVGLAVLAAQSRLRPAALAYGVALAVLVASGARDGASLMAWMNGLHAAVAVVLLAVIGRKWHAWIPWPTIAVAGCGLVAVALLQARGLATDWPVAAALPGAAAVAIALLGSTWWACADLRQALRR